MSADKTPKRGPKSAKNRPAKSHKADGTPKKRWSAADRTQKGAGPRTRGGQNTFSPRWNREGGEPRQDRFGGERTERRDGDQPRTFNRDDRPQRSFNRDDRPSFNRDDRPRNDRFGGDRNDRPQRSFNRDDRPAFNRDDRPQRSFNRDDRPAFNRDDRPQRSFNRDDRPAFNRDDRPRNDRFGGDRNERPAFNRDDRPAFKRDDRPAFNRDDRPRFNDRDDRRSRPARDGHWGGDVRAREDRGGRSFAGKTDDRPRFERNDRPRFERNDRNDRPRFERNDRPSDDSSLDQMDWQQEEVVDLDTTGVDHEGGFSTLGLPDEIVAMLTKRGIHEPFPIQVATIPDALAGRDVLGRARTGSGKTLAFSLPVVTRLSQDPNASHLAGGRRAPRALVLVPTRELALQVADVLSPLAASLSLKLVLVAGGMPYGPQTKAFDRGVDIVVATPGRLIDLLEQGAADLSDVQITVLDEADHMADLGFMPAVTTLLDAVTEGGQKLLFSATLDGAVDRLVKKYMSNPALHEVDSGKASVTTMRHEVFLVKPHDKVEVTARIANREGRTVIFARTQLGTDRVAAQLRESGVMAGSLHGGLTQGARARMLAAFKEGTLPVLVATDVAARGIHVDEVSLVLQIDPPMNGKDYTHRAGRTARAGSEGAVISIVLPHQRRQTLRMIGSTGVKVDPVDIRPEDEALVTLTGAAEPNREPISEDQLKVLVAPRQASRRPRPEGRGGYDNNRGGGFNRGGSRGGFNRGGSGGGGYRGNKGGYGKPRVAEAGGWNRDN